MRLTLSRFCKLALRGLVVPSPAPAPAPALPPVALRCSPLLLLLADDLESLEAEGAGSDLLLMASGSLPLSALAAAGALGAGAVLTVAAAAEAGAGVRADEPRVTCALVSEREGLERS
jgi:hypothetical protein